MRNYKIAVAGTGYVGLSLGVLLSQYHQVVAVDIVQAKVDMINNKKSPIQDEYIEKYLAEKELDLTATLDAKEAYSDADFVVIAAPTNYDSKKNFFDTSAVEAVIKLVIEYNPEAIMLKDYKGSITVKIDAIAASAASVVAMAGDTVQMSPVAMLMIHDPSTVAMGNTKDMEKAIEVLTEVKESIINAYAAKSGLSHARIANLMSNETWMNAKKAVELGFADEILFAKKEEEPDSDPVDPENPEEDPDSEPGEGEEKKPFQKDTAGHLFSSRQMDLIVLNRLGVKPEDVGQKYTEPKKPDAEPPADPKPSAEPTPPAEPPANLGPVLDMDGKTEDGSIPYNILMKQLECMK